MSKTVNQLTEATTVALSDVIVAGAGSTLRRVFFSNFITSLLTNLYSQIVLTFQPAPATQSTTATLSLAQIQARILTSTPAAAITLTLPTGTSLDGFATPFPDNTGFDWTVVNTSANAVTIAANTGVTLTGAATVAANTSATFRFRRVSAGSYQAYRA